MNVIKKFMLNIISLLELFHNEEGYFIIQFRSKSDRDAVLVIWPYTIYHKTCSYTNGIHISHEKKMYCMCY